MCQRYDDDGQGELGANDIQANHIEQTETRGARHSAAVGSDFCAVAPSPELKQRIQAERAGTTPGTLLAGLGVATARAPRRLGFDDGVLFPPSEYAVGTPYAAIRNAAAERAPLRGAVRVVVVLVEFSDRKLSRSKAEFADLFFSTQVLPHGSVREYYREVTGGLVDIVGEVVGPYQLPKSLAWYANGNFGIGRPRGTPRANIMAADTARAANPHVDFAPYDNDGNGYVDAFIVVHAGPGGEQTGDPNDIWSHKWTLPQVFNADGRRIYAYLTIPEDARIGVCAHELGHLLFGFPDLYDIDGSSEGVGNWCLMGGGSWNGGGHIPAHPSAWCKLEQGWASSTNITANGTLTLPDVKSSRSVHRVWKNGEIGPEYFLIENRQQTGYDAALPGSGLLVWHIDESQQDNADENHYKVTLLQSDARRDLELDLNRGDAGDPYPGTTHATRLDATTTPSSKSHADQVTGVCLADISTSGPAMTIAVSIDGSTPTISKPATSEPATAELARAVANLDERLSALERAMRAEAPPRPLQPQQPSSNGGV